MKRRRMGTGRIFRRKSRLTGKALPIYWVAYYVRDENGHPMERRESTETADFDEAKAFLHKRLGEAAQGKARPVHVERVTVSDLLELLVRDYEDQGQTVPPGHIAAWRDALGSMRAVDVKRDHIMACVRRWKHEGVHPERKGNAPALNGTCNRYVATLRRAFSLGRRDLELSVPLTFPREDESARGRYIPPAEFAAILREIPSETKRAVCEFAYLTGVRKGQLRATELANVDAERWVLTWRPDQTKGSDPHVLPLVGRTKAIVQALWALRRLDCRYLFHENGKRLGLLRSEWNRACKKAGFPVGRKRGGHTFHDTRHSAISNLHSAGIPDSVAMSISNHRTTSVFLRYGIRHENAQRAALEQVDAYLQGLESKRTVRPIASRARRGRRA